jgi:integrase
LEELLAVAKKECEIPVLKSAFLFSCLTGLRWSDIEKLTWSEIQHTEVGGNVIRFRTQKTKSFENHFISKQAFELLGERGNPDDKVFAGLKYSAWNNLKLQQWIFKADIHKTITFHCARHTYATLQISLGTDVYTLQSMLGHKSIKNTQIYAKIMDDRKKEAANRLNIEL